MRNMYFVDMSTVDLNTFISSRDFASSDEVIIVFYTGCNDLSLDCLHKLFCSGIRIETIITDKVDVDKILLMSLIAKCSKYYNKFNYKVVSNDKGFYNVPNDFIPGGLGFDVIECESDLLELNL